MNRVFRWAASGWKTPLVAALFPILLTACQSWITPGQTIVLVSGNANEVAYEYTHWYGSELPLTKEYADKYCMTYGKMANFGYTLQKTEDRNYIKYSCE